MWVLNEWHQIALENLLICLLMHFELSHRTSNDMSNILEQIYSKKHLKSSKLKHTF